MPVMPKDPVAKETPAGAHGKPPALNLRIGARLGMLAMFNIIPLIGGLWVWYQLGTGNATMRTPAGHEWLWISAIVLVACMIMALTSWMVMPIGRWLRDYPTWQFRNRSQLVWFVPAVAGWSAWLAIYLIGAATTLACVVVAGSGLWHLFGILK